MTSLQASWLSWPQTQALMQAFGAHPFRFVGGAVRDALLGRPTQDVDLATPILPHDVMKLLQEAGIKAIPTGIDHGTITAVIDKKQFEITTLRRDVSTDGRRATIAYTEDWKQDAARRDFTMNALYCDASGNVTDYFGGADDARAGRVRFIGDAAERIREDALRILRFFRFFAHYGKDPIDQTGLTACASSAASIDTLSGERIQMEMLKLLVAERAYEAVSIMQHYEIWPRVVGHVVNPQSLAALPALLRKADRAPDAILSLACLLRSIRHPERSEGSNGIATLIDTIAARWKLSKVQHRRLRDLCEIHPVFPNEKAWKRSIRMLGKELFIDQLILQMAQGAEEASALAAIAFARSWQIPTFPLTGDDLLAVGIKPGKQMGELLSELEAYWEEGGYTADKKTLLKRVC